MTTPKTPKNRTTIETVELQKLLHHVHTSPHNILGCHPSPTGTMVRVYRPGADSVSVLLEDGSEIAMDKNHPEGLFEKAFPEPKGVFPYRLKVRYGRETFTVQDPYRFMPTLGEMDLYLFNQGSHEELHEKFGAHFLKHQGVEGVSFSVWAPNAAGVAVVGDFNGWDGRLNPMRNMGSSGVWEIFIPDVQDHAHYKFEIHTQNGHLLLKTDPPRLLHRGSSRDCGLLVQILLSLQRRRLDGIPQRPQFHQGAHEHLRTSPGQLEAQIGRKIPLLPRTGSRTGPLRQGIGFYPTSS